jgi:hypothetical protein
MFSLIKKKKEKGKTAILEVVNYDEPSCLDIVKTAAEYGIDQVMGTVYFPSIHSFLDKKNIPYKPFVGKVSGNPSILDGSPGEIIKEAKDLLRKGISGFDLLAYRYIENAANGQAAEKLAREFLKETDGLQAKTSISGGIRKFEQIKFVLDAAPWAFTIGSALFEKKFAPNGSFRDNLSVVLDYYTTLIKGN